MSTPFSERADQRDLLPLSPVERQDAAILEQHDRPRRRFA
jgi:hypothetical protein